MNLYCRFRDFVLDHTPTTHTMVAVYGILTGFYTTNSDLRADLTGYFAHHKLMGYIFALILFAVPAYKGSHTIDAQAKAVDKALTVEIQKSNTQK